MPFVQRVVEPRFLSRTGGLWDEDGKKARVSDGELEAVTNGTLSNALRQLASLVLVADDIFAELGHQLADISGRSAALKARIRLVDEKVAAYDPKKVTVPESDICTFALLKEHYAAKQCPDTNLFTASSRPKALQTLYEAASKTPVHLMRQLDRWRRDGHRSSRFFLCTPVLGNKRRRIRAKVDIDIETGMPAAVKELRRWTSSEALGDITVTPDCPNRIIPNGTVTDGETTDGTIASDDEGIDHKLPSPEEQLQVIALKFPAEIVAVDISGRSFDRMSVLRRSLLHGDVTTKTEEDPNAPKRKARTRRPRSRRRNTLAGTDQKEIRDALTAGEEPSSSSPAIKSEPTTIVARSKSSDILRSTSNHHTHNKKDKDSPDKKSHFNTLKQWGKNRYDWLKNKACEGKACDKKESADVDDFNIYETVTMKRTRSVDRDRRSHERNPSISSSSEKSSVLNIAVKLRDSSAQRRQRRSGGNKDEPHSSSGNWSASSESGRASIGSEFTNTTHPKSTTSAATSINSLNQQAPNSINSRRRFNVNTSTSSSVTSEGTLTPDIIHDLHEDGDSVYSCDTEGYYTSFHMDSGLKTLKEEELPSTPLHYTSAFSNSSNNTVLTAENEYELFGKGSTSTTTSSAGTVCTTLRASGSSRSLSGCPVVPERKSSLQNYSGSKNTSPESSLERDAGSDKTGTVKRSPATTKTVAMVHQETGGDVSPDSGHNTSSSPIESISSPNGVRSGSEFEFSESSDMEGPERIERIRVKTTINSSRIPSMCVITPNPSDDEEDAVDSNCKDGPETPTLKGDHPVKLVVNVNPQSGYASIDTIADDTAKTTPSQPKASSDASRRAPSPSGGSVTINADLQNKPSASPTHQPIIKASLLPLNNMFGRLKNNLANLGVRRDSKSPNRDVNCNNKSSTNEEDDGEYVTLADVRNNNELIYANDIVNKNLRILKKDAAKPEYVSLDELPCNEVQKDGGLSDSLERTKRQGARVTLDAEGKVVYSSDSLKRRKAAHTTFEPGTFVKKDVVGSPKSSPLPVHRTPRPVRPVVNQEAGKLVIRASSAASSAPHPPEISRVPAAIASSATVRSATSPIRGAYVHVQDAGRPMSPAQDKERVPSPPNTYPAYPPPDSQPPRLCSTETDMYNYRSNLGFDENVDRRRYLDNQYYHQHHHRGVGGGGHVYQTLPNRKPHHLADIRPERSVTPDITRGLERNFNSIDRRLNPVPYHENEHHKLGIPVRMPDIGSFRISQVPYYDEEDPFRISPIDPRSCGGFKSSTPSSKTQELRAAANLESRLLSPKKSTMSNEELYAVIHKSKKKMNIETDANRASPVLVEAAQSPAAVKSPETGYIGDRSRSRLSWSPTKGEYVDFNADIDKLSPPNESRNRQSWACSDRKGKGNSQTSRLDFKKLLLQKSSVLAPPSKKLSAVEQLKLSKQQIQTQKTPPPAAATTMNILDLSGSPRNLTRKFSNPPPGSPVRYPPEKPKPAVKLMSPKSQWRFTNPRSDVLSSTILEDCREDESPNNSIEKKRQQQQQLQQLQFSPPKPGGSQNVPISQRIQARRAQFFGSTPPASPEEDKTPTPPTLETAF